MKQEEYLIVDMYPKQSASGKELRFFNHKKMDFFSSITEAYVYEKLDSAISKLTSISKKYPNRQFDIKPLSDF